MQPTPPTAAPESNANHRKPASVPLDPERLAAERNRLVRYCAKFTGNLDVADDLAQEALLIAWRSRDRLRDAQVWQEWLTGIVRNVCMRWRHAHLRDQSRRTDDIIVGGQTPTPLRLTLEEWPDPAGSDIDALLERREMLHLLDRAMALLGPRSRGVLVDRYVNNLPITEIAARRGVGEEAAAMQLYRSRQALKRTLAQPALREESIAYGLVDRQEASWQETRIWCPHCGAHYLKGILDHCPESGARIFALRCPGCTPGREGYLQHYVIKPTYKHAHILEGVKGIKPAMNRFSVWWDDFARTSAKKGTVSCMRCDRLLPIQHQVPESIGAIGAPSLVGHRGITALCEACKSFRFAGATDISMNDRAAREFWREYPRMRTEEAQEVMSADGKLLITRFISVTSSARLEVVVAEKTMAVIAANRMTSP